MKTETELIFLFLNHFLSQHEKAYACHNPSIGYCQSMNFICGMALLFMDEEDAFWLLAAILEELLPVDYYTKTMIGSYVDQYVLMHIVKVCFPSIHKKLEAVQLQLPLVTVIH